MKVTRMSWHIETPTGYHQTAKYAAQMYHLPSHSEKLVHGIYFKRTSLTGKRVSKPITFDD
jgi:hypothetical protein